MSIKVLIVEDDADTRHNMFDILQLNDYETDTALTARDALERIDETLYDLIAAGDQTANGSKAGQAIRATGCGRNRRCHRRSRMPWCVATNPLSRRFDSADAR